MVAIQQYPRLNNNYLDETELKPHIIKISEAQLKAIIGNAIQTAAKKSSQAILELPDDTTTEEITKKYTKEGHDLFKYFVKYCGDAAVTALQCSGRHYSEIAKEQFHKRGIQKDRMNSAWRYQCIAKDAAAVSKRFDTVSDIGLTEADFNVTITYKKGETKLTIYVSVKNRSNTMGGQDWPKAIAALEKVAIGDKNRDGAYICVFGLSVERGKRLIKSNKEKTPYSYNTELWFADYFWPFFSNYSYEEIANLVLDVLIETKTPFLINEEIPKELIDSFGKCCKKYKIVDDKGYFIDPHKLVSFFCGNPKTE